jgi:hypothetical protein
LHRADVNWLCLPLSRGWRVEGNRCSLGRKSRWSGDRLDNRHIDLTSVLDLGCSPCACGGDLLSVLVFEPDYVPQQTLSIGASARTSVVLFL